MTTPLLQTKLYIPLRPVRSFDWAQDKVDVAPALDRTAERGALPRTDADLNSLTINL